jgi:hypothetical protein
MVKFSADVPQQEVRVKTTNLYDIVTSNIIAELQMGAIPWLKPWKGGGTGHLPANAVRLPLHALAYNLGNFLRTLALPEGIKQWSLTSLREKLVKIGAKVVRHGRYVIFQMAEVAVPRELFQEMA